MHRARPKHRKAHNMRQSRRAHWQAARRCTGSESSRRLRHSGCQWHLGSESSVGLNLKSRRCRDSESLRRPAEGSAFNGARGGACRPGWTKLVHSTAALPVLALLDMLAKLAGLRLGGPTVGRAAAAGRGSRPALPLTLSRAPRCGTATAAVAILHAVSAGVGQPPTVFNGRCYTWRRWPQGG